VSPNNGTDHERLSGAWNFRDVAQTTEILPGRLFRSSELSKLDNLGRAALTALSVTDVADLRSPA
jgi:protein-tyrosine phosphatase